MVDEIKQAGAPAADENHLIAERKAKLERLRERGTGVPERFPAQRCGRRTAHRVRRSRARMVRCAPDASDRRRPHDGQAHHGQGAFAKLTDRSGSIQLFLQQLALGATYDEFKGWDVGDIVGAEGTLFKTRTGELSVKVEKLRLLVKSLRPLPDKWHGLADVEQRYRQRYVDLIVSDESREVFRKRTQHRAVPAQFPRHARLHGSRDADAAGDPGRRRRETVRHAPQRARPRHVPAHRARAVPEAAGRRRLRARVRDQPQFPQRGPVDAAQPGIHDARAVPGVRRLPRLHGHGRAHVPGRRRLDLRHAPDRVPGRGVRLRLHVPSRDGRGPRRAFQSRHRARAPA